MIGTNTIQFHVNCSLALLNIVPEEFQAEELIFSPKVVKQYSRFRFAYVASVTLHEHFMNATNAENVSVNLEKAKNNLQCFGFVGFFLLFFFPPPRKVLFRIVYLPKIKLSQFSSILHLLFINVNVHCLQKTKMLQTSFDNFVVVTIGSNSSLQRRFLSHGCLFSSSFHLLGTWKIHALRTIHLITLCEMMFQGCYWESSVWTMGLGVLGPPRESMV